MRRGFTIVELLVVIGLIMVMTALSVSFSFNYLRRHQLDYSGQIMVTEIQTARSQSLAQADNAAHGIAIFPDHVIRFVGDSYATRVAAQDVRTDFFGSFTVSGNTEMIFPKGQANPSSAATVTLQDSQNFISLNLSAYGVSELSQGLLQP